MSFAAPNIFNTADFARMRTPARAYNPNDDYGKISTQLIESCRTNGYLGIAPQNLIEPAELLPVIVIPYYDKPIRTFVDPRIEKKSGRRIQIEGCANIPLVFEGKKINPGVKVARPTKVTISHMVESQRVTATYCDKRPQSSYNACVAGVICHELDHLKGLMLVDNARQRIFGLREVFAEEISKDPECADHLRSCVDLEGPFILARSGERYMLQFMSEFDSVPEVSPDVVFIDLFFRRLDDLRRIFVPREGELLPIVASDAVRALFEAR